ncbi:MAG: DUF929 family protein [Ferrimicrobium sp.]
MAQRSLSQQRIQRAQGRRQTSRRAPAALAIVVLAIVVLVVAFVYTRKSATSTAATSASSAKPVPSAVFSAITQVPASTLAAVGVNHSLVATPKKIIGSASVVPLVSNGKPEILYVGAEFCPYCAAERWAMIIALSRFGVFSNLHLMTSSSTDVYPNTNTFTFVHSTYTSKYLAFVPVETQTRTYAKLQPLTAADNRLLNSYDVPPYVPSVQNSGSIPFVDFGNSYVINGASYSPQILQGLNWQTIAATLSNPTTATAQSIDGTANEITAATCVLTHNHPGSVCQTNLIKSLQAHL